MRTHALLLLVSTTVWSAFAPAADTSERTYADPACSARDVKPERCVLQDGPPKRVVVGARNATGADAGTANPNAASAGSTASTATGQTGQAGQGTAIGRK
jgi:hypothetical protein